MANLDIYLAENFQLPSSSGIGFFGEDGFGDSIDLNAFNSRTFVTNSSGTVEGFEADNCKLTTQGSWSGVGGVSGVIIGQTGSGIHIRSLPNYLATINVRFTHTESVRTQNANLFVYDGVTQTTAPTGIDVFCAEIIHTDEEQTQNGTGDSIWQEIGGSGSELGLISSPGTSGLRPLGPATEDTRHDWYVAMSVRPTTPNNKTFGFGVSFEFI